MTSNTALSLTLLSALVGCSSAPEAAQPEPSDARYVTADELVRSDDDADSCVLTSVPLLYVSPVDAETRLRINLPEGVLVSRVGASKQLLLQGPGSGVKEAIDALLAIDVR